jgi:hypothetical protein
MNIEIRNKATQFHLGIYVSNFRYSMCESGTGLLCIQDSLLVGSHKPVTIGNKNMTGFYTRLLDNIL